ncbi:unnamed protein product [Coregonus sp. 'balchen']|nr:unnamed protein product [Coregonus sp. 'balchen']
MIPKIVWFGYKNYEVVDKKRVAICKTCGSKITDGAATTSNFVRHLKLHKERYEEYQMNKIIVDEPQQPSISQFLDTRVGRYSLTHPQQKAISNAILSDLIIDCNFPLSIVENKSFRHFLAVLDSKYTPSQEGITAPFSDTVYLKAAALDPAFCLLWIEPHVLVNRDIKAEVAQRVKELILQDAAETEQPVPVPAEEELEDMEGEGLFAAYHKRQKRDVGTPPAVQLSHYIDMAEGQNALLFWALNSKTLPSLFQVAIRVLAVPASSAPVERVFSHGGIILRPHRAQMTDRLLANLIFCKCNAV